ncbi:MAG: ABC transporter permease [Cyclobacteriaceae bacterium]
MNQNRPSAPPKWAIKFLNWYCDPQLLEDLLGDLLEIYEETLHQKGLRQARRQFIWLVLRSFRWSAIKTPNSFKTRRIMMTKQNLKVATRVLWKDKFNTILNTFGLSIGIVCFVLMGLFVIQEYSFDHMHSKKDRIYRAYLSEDYGDDMTFFNTVTPIRFESLFEDNFPEFEEVVQYSTRTLDVSPAGDNWIEERIAIISPEFFQVFDFTIIDGDAQDPFTSKYDVIISQQYADKYFGLENPIGKSLTLKINDKPTEFTIAALVEDLPKNSSIQFDLAISNELNTIIHSEQSRNGWFSVSQETYVLLQENATLESVTSKMQDVIMSHLAEEVGRDEYNPGFQPLLDIHLNPEYPAGIAPVSNPKYVNILGAIGLLVLFVACINYTTLAIGKSLRRTKEVGMRKVLGAVKSQLIGQYMTESVLVASVSMLIGTLSAVLLIPFFNQITGVTLIYQFEWMHLLLFALLALIIGFLAGFYPAIVLTNTQLMAILSAKQSSRGNHWIRKGMVTFQFLVTMMLISSTLIMSKQVGYLKSKDLGYNYEAVISIPLHGESESGRFLEEYIDATRNADLLKQALAQHTELTNLTTMSHAFGSNGWANLAFEDKNGSFRWFRMLGVDDQFIDAFDLELVAGRSFEEGNTADERQSILINESAVSYFGLDNPIGDMLPGNNFGDHRIIGVVKDFHFSSLHQSIEPLVITQNIVPMFQGISDAHFAESPIPKLVLKYTGTDLLKAGEILEAAWEEIFPNHLLNYTFVDENMARLYENEDRLNKLIGVASAIAIVIAAIGLLGLTVLVVNTREKEIGIRKITGARPVHIFGLLVNTFSWQLLLGIAISIPVTFWLMTNWLQDFAYQVNIGVDMFLLSALLSVVVALLVVSFHAWKAANQNPVKSLRAE